MFCYSNEEGEKEFTPIPLPLQLSGGNLRHLIVKTT